VLLWNRPIQAIWLEPLSLVGFSFNHLDLASIFGFCFSFVSISFDSFWILGA
jgi:hypothetical protein